MLRDRLKRMNHLHTVIGVVLGWLLFTVCFSGSVAMFYDEMVDWEDPGARRLSTDVPRIAINPMIDDFIHRYEGEVTNLFLSLPGSEAPYYRLFGSFKTEDGTSERETQRYDLVTGEAIGAKLDGPATWLLRFHQNLQIERRLGRSLVGIAGVFMLVSLLTGVIIHRKILKDLYKLRWHRSMHLKWKDLHTGLGVWTLPFSITISFTGAILGLVVLFLPILALLAFKGDQEAAIQAITGPPIEASGVAAPMAPLEDLLNRIDSETPYRADGVALEHYGDSNARYKVFADADSELVRFVQVDANAVTGEYDPPSLLFGGLPQSPVGRVYAAITPLHYGTYGGMLLKVVYYFVGMVVTLSIAIGTLIYLERRLDGPIGHRSRGFYVAISRINAGLTAGLALASIAIFYTDRLWGMLSADRSYASALAFLSIWAAAIVWALVVRHPRNTARQLLAGTALFCLGLPVLDMATAPGAPQTHAALVVNAVIFVSGALLGAYLLVSRQAERRTQQAPTSALVATQQHPVAQNR